jgi:hypothetical protein
VFTSCISCVCTLLISSFISVRRACTPSREPVVGVGATKPRKILAMVSSTSRTRPSSEILIDVAGSTFRFFGLAGHAVVLCHSSHPCVPLCLKLGVENWYSARLPISCEASPRSSDPGTLLEGVPPPPSLEVTFPPAGRWWYHWDVFTRLNLCFLMVQVMTLSEIKSKRSFRRC